MLLSTVGSGREASVGRLYKRMLETVPDAIWPRPLRAVTDTLHLRGRLPGAMAAEGSSPFRGACERRNTHFQNNLACILEWASQVRVSLAWELNPLAVRKGLPTPAGHNQTSALRTRFGNRVCGRCVVVLCDGALSQISDFARYKMRFTLKGAKAALERQNA